MQLFIVRTNDDESHAIWH